MRLPDIFVVDGGKGQVSAFCEALKEFHVRIPVVGIAKGRQGSGEKLIIPGRANPYLLGQHRPLYNLLTSMRDEAHRFSRRLHHKGEKARVLSSWLDQVQGVGPVTRWKILRNLRVSREELAEMKVPELRQHLGVGQSVAQNIWTFLRRKKRSN